MSVHIDSPPTGGPSCLVLALVVVGVGCLFVVWPLAPVAWFVAGGLAWVEGQPS